MADSVRHKMDAPMLDHATALPLIDYARSVSRRAVVT